MTRRIVIGSLFVLEVEFPNSRQKIWGIMWGKFRVKACPEEVVRSRLVTRWYDLMAWRTLDRREVGSDTHCSKSVADLEKFSRERVSVPLHTLDDFAKYWNTFDGIARRLIDSKIITKAERDLYFWTGLPLDIRRSIGEQLAIADLSYHDRTVPTWRDAIQAGRFIYHDPTLSSPKQDKDIDKLVRTLHSLNVEDSNYAVAYARLLVVAPSVADRIRPPARWSPPARSSTLSVQHPSPRIHAPHTTGESKYCRQTLRRVQSYVSYQSCPTCADQHVVHRAPGI
ncbi:hypothetical protein P691DRAFT_790576 [Macrolepiota fuliginosa MF-IS2]|uniref:Uncharacterized protein n=1 Tax=Macrolepiota fuliginosa MF-IS2 TaxID=1400762 RepID=A0A9P5XH70_9AGAR|nr:hypothetical protein P691DRAFT_790576 [Macrolepiota fuliginosa MF-IS2]